MPTIVRWSLLLVLLVMPLQALTADDKLKIFVSVLPQKLFVERVGGDAVTVEVMVKPGFSPATYEPSPRQITALSKAQLYIRMGVPFEQAWLPRIRSVNPDMLMLDARTGIELLEMAEHDHGHEHESEHNDNHDAERDSEHDKHDDEHDDNAAHDEAESETDAHLWTDPQLVVTMAEQIRQQLTALRPAHAEAFKANYTTFVAELNALDAELRLLFKQAGPDRQQKFLVFHPSWGYFAAAYGMTQLAIEAEGKEPGAKALQALIKQARDAGVKTIFVQPQFDQRAARQVARAIDGNVVALDPLTEDYFATMRQASRLLAGVGNN